MKIKDVIGLFVIIMVTMMLTIMAYDANFNKSTVCPCKVTKVEYDSSSAIYTVTVTGLLTDDFNFNSRDFSFKSWYEYHKGDIIK